MKVLRRSLIAPAIGHEGASLLGEGGEVPSARGIVFEEIGVPVEALAKTGEGEKGG